VRTFTLAQLVVDVERADEALELFHDLSMVHISIEIEQGHDSDY